jgi:hypothetical protein
MSTNVGQLPAAVPGLALLDAVCDSRYTCVGGFAS